MNPGWRGAQPLWAILYTPDNSNRAKVFNY